MMVLVVVFLRRNEYYRGIGVQTAGIWANTCFYLPLRGSFTHQPQCLGRAFQRSLNRNWPIHAWLSRFVAIS